MLDKMYIHSSWGTITINNSGEVLEKNIEEIEGEESFLLEVVKFDLEEWKKYWETEELPADFDVLDLGFWNKDGEYVIPDNHWRELIKTLD